MSEYLVQYSLNIEADNELEAARTAQAIMRDRLNPKQVFEVSGEASRVWIDLEDNTVIPLPSRIPQHKASDG